MNKVLLLLLVSLPFIGFSQEVLIPDQKDGKWGYLAFDTKKVIVPHQYDEAEKFSYHGFAKARIGDHWGLLNVFGKEVLAVQYDTLSLVQKNKSPLRTHFKKDGKWGIMDDKFNLLIPNNYDEIRTFYGYFHPEGYPKNKVPEFYKVKKDNRWGIIDHQNEILIPINYTDITPIDYSKALTLKDHFSISEDKIRRIHQNMYGGHFYTRPIAKDFVLVRKGETAFIVKMNGEIIFTIEKYKNQWNRYDPNAFLYESNDENLKDEVFIINVNGKEGMLSKDGKIILPFEYENINFHYNNFFTIKKQDKYGIINSKGEIIQTPQFDRIQGQMVLQNKKIGILQPNLQSFLLPIEFDAFTKYSYQKRMENGQLKFLPLYKVQKNNQEGLMDSNGEIVIPIAYQNIRYQSSYVENLVVQKDGKWGLIDLNNNIVLDFQHDIIKDNREWQISMLVKKENKYGMLNPENGEWYIPIQYDSIFVETRKKILVQENKKWGVLNDKFELVTEIKYDEIKNFKGRIGEKWEELKSYKQEVASLNLLRSSYRPSIKKEGEKYGVIDKNGRWLLPAEYDEIKREYSYFLLTRDGKKGLLAKDSTFLIPTQYQDIKYYSYEKFIKVKKDEKWGVINSQNKIVIPLQYERIENLGQNLIKIYDGKYWKLINYDGEEINGQEYSSVNFLSNMNNRDLIFVSQLYRSGIIDKKGNTILPCKFEKVIPDINKINPVGIPDLYPVQQNKKWGYAKKGGAIVIPCQFEKVSFFRRQVALIKKDSKFYLIDTKGNIISKDGYYDIKGFNLLTDLAIVTDSNNKRGAINGKGEEIIPVIYDEVNQINEFGVRSYLVKLEGKYGIINHDGKIRVPIESEIPIRNQSLGFLSKYGPLTLTGLNGNIMLSTHYDKARRYYQNLFTVTKNNKVGLIDILTEKIIIPLEYDQISTGNSSCFKNLIFANKREKMGAVDTANNIIIPFEYDFINPITFLNRLILKKEGKLALADFEGNIYTKFEFDDIKFGTHPPLLVKKNEKWGYITLEGKEAYPIELEQGSPFYPYYENIRMSLNKFSCDSITELPEGLKLQAQIQKKGIKYFLSPDGKLSEFSQKKRVLLVDNIYREIDPLNYDRYLVDQEGNKILPNGFSQIHSHCNGFIPLNYKRGPSGYYLPLIKKEIRYDEIQIRYHDNAPIRWVKKDGFYGFIDNEGRAVTPFHFERVGRTEEGFISVMKDGKLGFLNEMGEMVIPMIFDDDGNFHPIFINGIAYAFLDGKYGFIDQAGKVVAPFEYEAIAYFDKGIGIAFRNGKWEKLVF